MSAILLVVFLCFSCAGHAKKRQTLPAREAVFHNNRGVVELGKQDLERAEFEFRTAVELSPYFAEPYNNLGVLYKIKGQNKEAIHYFNEAIARDKKYVSPYSHLSAVYLAMGDLGNALKMGRKGVKIGGLDADAHYNLGLVYAEMYSRDKKEKNLELADKYLKRATVLNPKLEPVHLQLAEMYKQQGEPKLAVIRYRLALEISNSPEVWKKLGDLYLEIGEPYKAQNCFQQALKLNPNAEEAQVELGIFYLQQKRFDDALAAFRNAIQINPSNERAYFSIGTIQMELKKPVEATLSFKKAKEINPRYSDAVYNLGLVYLQSGKTAEAEEEWLYITRVDKTYARAHYNLAVLYSKQGEKKKSLEHYCSFVQSAGDKFKAEVSAAREYLSEEGYACRK